MLRQLLDDRQRSLRIAEDRVFRSSGDRIQDATTRLAVFLPRLLGHFGKC